MKATKRESHTPTVSAGWNPYLGGHTYHVLVKAEDDKMWPAVQVERRICTGIRDALHYIVSMQRRKRTIAAVLTGGEWDKAVARGRKLAGQARE